MNKTIIFLIVFILFSCCSKKIIEGIYYNDSDAKLIVGLSFVNGKVEPIINGWKTGEAYDYEIIGDIIYIGSRGKHSETPRIPFIIVDNNTLKCEGGFLEGEYRRKE